MGSGKMTRQYIKSISDRLDDISSTGNDNYDDGSSTNDDSYKIDKYDDEYYLDIGSEPPRFAYYTFIPEEAISKMMGNNASPLAI
jgi:hypothetical protein